MWWLFACAAPDADTFLVYVRDADGTYEVAPRALPELADPSALAGELGTGAYGGALRGDEWTPDYTGGRALDLQYAVEDGVAVPVDQDGLLLWSFYAHLADARTAIEAHGVDLSDVFPLDIAWNPAVEWDLELAPADNAAYATGTNLFVLLPDGDARDVPIVANAGVVLHETGHAVFHLLTAGGPHEPPVVQDYGTEASDWQASLHEGFADSTATLALDDPHFLDPTLDMPERYVDGSAIMTDDLLPSTAVANAANGTDLLGIYDPYPLGTVFASAAWDVRVALDDPDETLNLLYRAGADWEPDADFDGWSWLEAWADAAATQDELDAVCAAVAGRFAGYVELERC